MISYCYHSRGHGSNGCGRGGPITLSQSKKCLEKRFGQMMVLCP